MKLQKILSLMLALVLLVGSMPAFAKSAEILVLESLADSAEEEIAEEASVAVEEALPAEEPMEILPELPAPKIIMQPEWQAVEGTGAVLIPAAEKIRFEWEEVADADFYRIETSRRPAEGEEEVRVEVGSVEENHIDLTAANYSGDWYAIYVTAEAADGRVSFDACIFRVEEPAVEEPVEEEVAEEIDVSVEETALTIVSYPKSVTVAEGEKATVTVEAQGDGLSYVWYTREASSDTYYKSSISGPTYSVVMNAARSGRRLICYVYDKYGNKIQCPTVMIKMKNPLEIVSYPQNVTVAEGEKATVTVEARGDGLTYTWYTREASSDTYYKSSISGPTYSVVMNAARSGRRLICYVSDKYGNKIQCPTVLIKMKASLAITQDIADVAVAEGEKATVTVKATGTGLNYKWYYKDAGASTFKLTTSFTGNTYSISMTAARAGRQVYCVVTDANGNSVTSATATLKMKTRLAITQDIADVGVNEGETARVTVKATGEGLTYAWYFKDITATKFSLTNSYKTASYDVTMTAARNGRQVYCVITDAYGESIQSATATLKIRTPLAITQNIADVTVDEGAKASVTVKAVGDGLSYAWYSKDTNQTKFYKSSSFTGNSYYITMTAARAGRQVYCIISDAYGNTVQSDTATLYMTSPFIVEEGEDGCLTITGYAGETPAELVIPSRISGKKVTAIGVGAFVRKDSLTSVTISDGITSIGESAFAYSDRLESVTIGNGTTSIGEHAFESCCKMKSISIPGSVTSIGECAFYNCEDLESITLPADIRRINRRTFYSCESLTEIHIPDSVESIGSGAFEMCYSLANVEIGSGVNTICESAFYHCSSLTSIVIPNSVKTIEGKVFYNCEALESVTMGNAVKSIGDFVFYNCGEISEITIPVSVTYISTYAFDDCSAHLYVYYGSYAESWCRNVIYDSWRYTILNFLEITQDIADVVVAEGEIAKVTVEAIGVDLAYEWYFKDVGDSDFKKTSAFTGNSYYVTMTAERAGRQVYCVVSGANSDSQTTSIATLKMKTPLAITQDIADVAVDEGKTAKVTVKATGEGLTYAWYFKDITATKFSLTNSYKTASYDVTMTAARNGRQVYCVITDAYGESIKSATATLRVKTPLTITQNIADVTVDEGEMASVTVEVVGDGLTYAWYSKDVNQTKFYKSSYFTGKTYSVEMNSERDGRKVYCIITDAYGNTAQTDAAALYMTSPFVAEVGEDYCWKIVGYNGEVPAELVIPSHIFGIEVTAIGNEAFMRCTNLQSVTIPNSVKAIGMDAFSSCSNLESVTINSGSIGEYAFYRCNNLESVTINSGSIGSYAFCDCKSLTRATLGSGVTGIGGYAFYRCSSLESITIPDSVESIGDYSFWSCSKLTSVTLGNNVGSIGAYAFYSCSSLEGITIPDSVESIGECAFSDCSGLTRATLGSGVTSIGKSAFSSCSNLVSVTLGSGVTSIGERAFWNCSSLKSISIPASVETIGDRAFEECNKMTSATVASGSIGDRAFFCCFDLSNVTLGIDVTSIGQDAFEGCEYAQFKVPSGSYAHEWCQSNYDSSRYTVI